MTKFRNTKTGYPYTSQKNIFPKIICQKNISLNVLFPKLTIVRNHTCQNEHLPEITSTRMNNCPKFHFPENLFSRIYTCQNVRLAEITFPRKLIFQNLHLPECTLGRNYISPRTYFPHIIHIIDVARIFDWGRGPKLQITCNDVIRNF